MMTSLSRFWPLLENLRPLAAVSAEWQLWLGPVFAQLRPLLRPQDTLATAYPKLVAGRSPLPYRVVTHGPEDHEGICPDTEEIIRLTTAQLTVYELSETSLLRSLARALGVQGLWEALAGFRDTYRLGIRRTNGSRDRPVFFSYAGDPSALRHLADHLAATDGPAILATPTSATHTAALAESVRRRGSLLLTLDNAVAVGADGQFVATIDLDAAVAHEDLATRPTVTVDSGLNVFHRRGDFWQLPNVRGKRAVRYVLFDSNYWKSFVYARLATAMGDAGCLSLFGRDEHQHRLFAEHLTAEYRIRTEGRGRTVDEWKLRPERSDNHWFDGIVGCAVAASIQGSTLLGTDVRPSKPRRRLKLSDLQRGNR